MEEGLNVERSGFAVTMHTGLKTDETTGGAGKRWLMSLLDSLSQTLPSHKSSALIGLPSRFSNAQGDKTNQANHSSQTVCGLSARHLPSKYSDETRRSASGLQSRFLAVTSP